MPHATFGYDGIRVRVSTPSGQDLQWLKEFLLPWFDLTDGAADMEVVWQSDARYHDGLQRLRQGDRIDAFMLDRDRLSYPRVELPGEQLAFHDADSGIFYLVTRDRVRLITGERQPPPRTALMRVVRELAMGSAQLSGGRFLHASSFAVDGRAAIVTGPRRAGKTSLLCYALANSSAEFLCNDRLLVQKRGNSHRLRGMPTIVSIRQGTMDLFPGMRQALLRNCYANRFTLEESRRPETGNGFSLKPERHGVTPGQFCALLRSRPAATAQASVLLFPRQTGGPGGLLLHRLTSADARRRLADCLFTHIGPDRLSAAFTPTLAEADRVAAPDDARLCAELAAALPAFDCELGTDSFNTTAGARQLMQLLLQNADNPASTPGNAVRL